MATASNTVLRKEIERLIEIAEVEVEQWLLARDELPFPNFTASIRTDEAWQSGISEGKEIGRLNALKEILRKIEE